MGCPVPQKRPGDASSPGRTLSRHAGVGSGWGLCRLRGRPAGLGWAPPLGTAQFSFSVGVGSMWPLVFSASSGELPGEGGAHGGPASVRDPGTPSLRSLLIIGRSWATSQGHRDWAETVRPVAAPPLRNIPPFTHLGAGGRGRGTQLSGVGKLSLLSSPQPGIPGRPGCEAEGAGLGVRVGGQEGRSRAAGSQGPGEARPGLWAAHAVTYFALLISRAQPP